MDDAMLDLMADHGGLRRRLDAYAEARLSPDLGATTRMRARVLAVAHRRSALARSDAALAVVAGPLDPPAIDPDATPVGWRSHPALRRTITLVLAATLALASVSGIALAARPGGGLYGARVWAETLTLPTDARQRVIAELDRLDERLVEIAAASASADALAVQAALLEYQRIVDQASAFVDATDDPVAEVALQEGVGNNVAVLSGLVDRLPAGGSSAVERALERAIERSTEAVESIKPGNGGGGGSNAGGGGGNGGSGGAPATSGPVATEAPGPTATPKPTKTPKPEATPKPTRTPKPEATKRPDRTPRPDPVPGGGGGSGAGGSGAGGAEGNGPPTPGD